MIGQPLVGEIVVCNWGSMQGEEFKVVALLYNGNYSCELVGFDGKFYEYARHHLDLKSDYDKML